MGDEGRIVRAADLRPRPWPNGLGTTRDVAEATGPDGRPDWLLSVADLERDAPFSHLPGLDRVFTLIEGDTIDLAVDDAPPLACRLLLPTHFPGDRPTTSRLTGGPGRAFNVFVDRSTRRTRVASLNLAAGATVLSEGDVAIVYAVEGTLAIGPARLGPGDTWIGRVGASVGADGPATLILAAIDPRG